MGASLVGVLFAFKRIDDYVTLSLLLILEGVFQPFPAKIKFLAVSGLQVKPRLPLLRSQTIGINKDQ